jgi:ferredoxin-like protein FixX
MLSLLSFFSSFHSWRVTRLYLKKAHKDRKKFWKSVEIEFGASSLSYRTSFPKFPEEEFCPFGVFSEKKGKGALDLSKCLECRSCSCFAEIREQNRMARVKKDFEYKKKDDSLWP